MRNAPWQFFEKDAIEHSFEEATILYHIGWLASEKDYWLSSPEPSEIYRAEGDLFWISFDVGKDFPFWTQKEFERYLNRLIRKKLLVKSEFNNKFWVRFP